MDIHGCYRGLGQWTIEGYGLITGVNSKLMPKTYPPEIPVADVTGNILLHASYTSGLLGERLQDVLPKDLICKLSAGFTFVWQEKHTLQLSWI